MTKIMNKKYMDFLEFCENYQLLNSQKRLKGLSKFKGESKKYRIIAEKKLKEITSFVQNASNQVRMRYILHNITEDNIHCPVDGCSGKRGWSQKNSRFELVCDRRDKNHLDYIRKIRQERAKESQLKKYDGWAAQTEDFKEKRTTTNLKKYGKKTFAETETFKRFMSENKEEFNQKRETTNLEKYGVKYICWNKDLRNKCIKNTRKQLQKKYGNFVISPGLINLKNLKDLNKEFIEKNFIMEDGTFDLVGMQTYFGFMSNSQPYLYLKKFKIKFNHKGGGFNPDKPAILYYLYDPQEDLYKIGITNKTIEERFGKSFCSNRAIAILEQTHFDNGLDAYLAEQEILEAFGYARCENPSWPEELGGRTEFFKEDILNRNAKISDAAEYYRFVKEHPGNFLNKTGMFVGPKKVPSEYKEVYHELRNQLKEITNWMPINSTDIQRMRVLKHNLNKTDYFCPVCSEPREYNTKKQDFMITCNKKDKEHLAYVYKHISDSREKTNLLKYGTRSYTDTDEFKEKSLKTVLDKHQVNNVFKSKEIQQKINKTNLAKYGGHPMQNKEIKKRNRNSILKNLPYLCTSPSQLHIKNKDKLNKEYLEENFLDNGYIKLEEMREFFNISNSACYYYMKNNNIKIKYKDGGFNPDEPAILYYLYDPQEDLYKIGITNKTIEERFGKSFCSNRAIAILEQTHFDNGLDAYLAEQEILEAFGYARCENPSWPETKGGRTEFFKEDILRLGR